MELSRYNMDDYNGLNTNTRYSLYNVRLDKFMTREYEMYEDKLIWKIRWIDEEDPPNEADLNGYTNTHLHALVWDLKVNTPEELVSKIIEEFQPMGLDIKDPLVLVGVSTIRGVEREYYDWKYYFHFEDSFSLNKLI